MVQKNNWDLFCPKGHPQIDIDNNCNRFLLCNMIHHLDVLDNRDDYKVLTIFPQCWKSPMGKNAAILA
jgi:hypothetical protein